METLREMFAAIGTSTLVSALLVYTLRQWISTRLRTSIEHEYRARETQLKAELQKELEGYRSGYQKALDENLIRFARLNAEQAQATKRLYSRLARLQSAMHFMTALFKEGVSTKDIEERARKHRDDVAQTHRDCREFFEENRILFPDDICDDTDRLLDEAARLYIDYSCSEEFTEGGARMGKFHRERELNEKVRQELAEMLRRLEVRFRSILGVVSTAQTENR